MWECGKKPKSSLAIMGNQEILPEATKSRNKNTRTLLRMSVQNLLPKNMMP